jgi:hypothetical protein
MSPIDARKDALMLNCFVTFARCLSKNEPMTVAKLKSLINSALKKPSKRSDIHGLEIVYNVLDYYLWLSIRFADMFPHAEEIKQMRTELEALIFASVKEMSSLNLIEGRTPLNRTQHHRSPVKQISNPK